MEGSPLLSYRSQDDDYEEQEDESIARKSIERVGGEEINDTAERCQCMTIYKFRSLAKPKGKFCRSYRSQDDDCEEQEDESIARKSIERVGGEEIDDTTERFQCMTISKSETSKRGDELSREKYKLWRQEQKTRAARLAKQLKARWELEELIEEQLNRFHAQYNRIMVPTLLKDVAQFLMPNWAPPNELAALSWLGDWRPSAILDLLRGLAHSSSSLSSTLSHTTGIEKLLSQLIHEIRIEEAIIDEEMAEIQATCVLHLPFGPLNKQSGSAALGCIQAEFKKIERVITKAQQLRFRALELVVKKVLSLTDAAEFLVAFSGVQDVIHQYAEHQSKRKCPVTVHVKALGSS